MPTIYHSEDGVRSHGDGDAMVRLECRECAIVCEQVVSPWNCLKSRCPYVYAFEGDDTTYFGCLYKVFAPELDLSAFTEGVARRKRGTDPYGPLRVVRAPRPHCRVWIECAYDSLRRGLNCCNPGFLYGSVLRS